jgi:hypothetical protein
VKRPRTQRTRLVAAVAAVALLPVTVLALAGGGGDEEVDAATTASTTSTTAPPTTTTIAREDLPPEAQELLDLVDRGRTGTFHARYTILSPGLGESAATAELEVWRDADRIRQDTVILDAAGPTRTAGFGSPTGTVGCQQAPGGAWSCRQVATEAYDPSEDFMTGILELLGASPVTVQDGTVGPFAGRCFALEGAELCLSAEGVPLRVDAGGTAYEVLELDDDVDDADFVPPAAVEA